MLGGAEFSRRSAHAKGPGCLWVMMELSKTHHDSTGASRMRLVTILNRVEKHKSFVYVDAEFESTGTGATRQDSLLIEVRPRWGSRPVCSACGAQGATYDTAPEERRFEFVPLWNIAVFFLYRMRRVDCQRCERVVVERVPWSDGKSPLTLTYRWFLAKWAKRLSWSEVATIFGTSWDSVCRSVEYAVEWGLAHRSLTSVSAIGIDEVAWGPIKSQNRVSRT